MTVDEMFKLFEQDKADNLKLSNEDGLLLLQRILNSGALSRFKITINNVKGQTLFQKFKSA